MNGNAYVNEFLELKCCGDILNAVSPLNKAEKEITETMSFIHILRDRTLQSPIKYNILDLCAGNALTSITSVFLLPIGNAVAVDKYKRNRCFCDIKRFEYVCDDINNEDIYTLINKNTVIISVHPCRELAKRVVEVYNKSVADSLYIMPCCTGKYDLHAKQFLIDNLGSYATWCYYLASLCDGSIKQDRHCLSEKNTIISSRKHIKEGSSLFRICLDTAKKI